MIPISTLTLFSIGSMRLTPISASLWKNPLCFISQILVLINKGRISFKSKEYKGVILSFLYPFLFLMIKFITSCKVVPLRYGSTSEAARILHIKTWTFFWRYSNDLLTFFFLFFFYSIFFFLKFVLGVSNLCKGSFKSDIDLSLWRVSLCEETFYVGYFPSIFFLSLLMRFLSVLVFLFWVFIFCLLSCFLFSLLEKLL